MWRWIASIVLLPFALALVAFLALTDGLRVGRALNEADKAAGKS